MIERYSSPEIAKLWEDSYKYSKWLEVELANIQVLEKAKILPAGTLDAFKTVKVDPSRIAELESRFNHDVASFIDSIAEQAGVSGKYFHYGLTSSDVTDTAQALILREASYKIQESLDSLLEVLLDKAYRYKDLACIGRTHGMHAEPTSFGLKFLSWYSEFKRQQKRFVDASYEWSYGKLSGAVGNLSSITAHLEKEILKVLSLKPEPVATQVIPRDRHATYLLSIANIGASVERVATELRHLQRSEVGEVEEFFSSTQKGSSIMPHKHNPISSENLTGCARVLRGYIVPALENVALWHERDISHSSAERIILADATILLHYMLVKLRKVLVSLKVFEDRITKNLGNSTCYSASLLNAMVTKGIERDTAYRALQNCAKQADFKQACVTNELINKNFSFGELDEIFDSSRLLKNVDSIYERVMKGE